MTQNWYDDSTTQTSHQTDIHTYIQGIGMTDGVVVIDGQVIQTMGPVEEWKTKKPDRHTYR